MPTDPMSELVKTTLQTKILETFTKDGLDLLNKLIAAALSQPVDPHNGRADGHGYGKIPYLDWLVGNSIRDAARDAIYGIVREHMEEIKAQVRDRLTADNLAQAIADAVGKAAEEDWRFKITIDRGERD